MHVFCHFTGQHRLHSSRLSRKEPSGKNGFDQNHTFDLHSLTLNCVYAVVVIYVANKVKIFIVFKTRVVSTPS